MGKEKTCFQIWQQHEYYCRLVWGARFYDSAPVQVVGWRKMSNLPENAGSVACDSWGIKRLFSYAVRRWLSGAAAPRAFRPYSANKKSPTPTLKWLLFAYVFFFRVAPPQLRLPRRLLCWTCGQSSMGPGEVQRHHQPLPLLLLHQFHPEWRMMKGVPLTVM